MRLNPHDGTGSAQATDCGRHYGLSRDALRTRRFAGFIAPDLARGVSCAIRSHRAGGGRRRWGNFLAHPGRTRTGAARDYGGRGAGAGDRRGGVRHVDGLRHGAGSGAGRGRRCTAAAAVLDSLRAGRTISPRERRLFGGVHRGHSLQPRQCADRSGNIAAARRAAPEFDRAEGRNRRFGECPRPSGAAGRSDDHPEWRAHG